MKPIQTKRSEIIELSEITQVVTIIGCDTYYGTHMVHHLLQKGKMVFGFSQDDDFSFDAEPTLAKGEETIPYVPAPIISDYLVICIAPNIGLEKYIAKIKQVCKQCLDKEYYGKIGFFSCGSICLTDCEPITESRAVAPKNEIELALATGENLLNVLLYNEQNSASPLIFRIGVPYGDELGIDNQMGFVNQFCRQASEGNVLESPIFDTSKRSVTHIADICEAVIMLLDQIDAPDTINIPGEVLSIAEIADKIARKHKINLKRSGLSNNSDEYFFVGNQQLDENYFKRMLNFKRQYTFDSWLAQT